MDFDPAAVTFEDVTREHPHRQYWKAAWDNYRLLYKGGEVFLRAAGQAAMTRAQGQSPGIIDLMGQQGNNRRRRFLFQLEGEPDTKYISRWERAYYVGYLPAMVDYFLHNLFSQPPRIRPALEDDAEPGDVPDPPEWHAPFIADCTGGGDSFLDFVKSAFLDVLVCQQGGWLIGQPAIGIGGTVKDNPGCVLTKYRPEEIIDWDEDAAGELEWIVLRKQEEVRDFPAPRLQVITYTYINRQSWAAWEEVVSPDKRDPKRIELVAAGDHGLGEVPFVRMTVPEGMWITNKLASWQVDLFNQTSMLSYGQLLSCFLQPAITSHEEGAENRIFGDGIVLKLRGGGKDRDAEKFEWIAPNPAPLEFQSKRILEQRDEGYRIAHQMSLAVDNAASNVGRSGLSKIEDRRASEVILAGYGGYVREAMVKTLNLVSRIVGDNTEWVVAGFDSFEVSSMMEELQTAALISTFSIQSPTFKAELQKDIASRVLDHLDEGTRQKIADEIEEAVEQQAEAVTAPPVPPGVVPPGATESDGDEAPEEDESTDAAPPQEQPNARF
jgi:hypothetical protein